MTLINHAKVAFAWARPVCGAWALALALQSGAANGAPLVVATPPNPERGLQLATKLCSNCHDVDGKSAPVQSAAAASSFASAANRPGQTSDRLEGYMLEPPHPAMPQVQLTREEIKDIAAYILTLKKP
jgi:mono/diheme cytochrome c family protein